MATRICQICGHKRKGYGFVVLYPFTIDEAVVEACEACYRKHDKKGENGMDEKMTISEGLGYLQDLKKRHNELITLRNENATTSRRFYGDKEIVHEPVYSVKAVDTKISKVAQEIRKLDSAIKAANAKTSIDYTKEESVWDAIE